MSLKVRTYKASDEVYAPAMQLAQLRGESLSDVIRAALVAYVKREEKRLAREGNRSTA